MEKNRGNDIVYIRKILKNINLLKKTFGHFDINDADDLASAEIAGLAVTQAVTNIYESKKNLTDETQQNLTGLKFFRRNDGDGQDGAILPSCGALYVQDTGFFFDERRWRAVFMLHKHGQRDKNCRRQGQGTINQETQLVFSYHLFSCCIDLP